MHRARKRKRVLIRKMHNFDQRICHIGELRHIKCKEKRHRARHQPQHNAQGVQHTLGANITPGKRNQNIAFRRKQQRKDRQQKRENCHRTC